MKIKQAELKNINTKALISLDKTIRLVFDININEENKVDTNCLTELMHQPLILDITKDLSLGN